MPKVTSIYSAGTTIQLALAKKKEEKELINVFSLVTKEIK